MAARPVIAAAVSRALSAMGIDVDAASVHLERPARRDHGDWSTNAALVNAKALGPAPSPARRGAGRAPPGRPARRTSHRSRSPAPGSSTSTWRRVAPRHPERGRRRRRGGLRPQRHRGGEKVQIEFISANPTGPIHVGNGWWGAYGDAMGRVMTRCGWQVHREYYVNDTGGQIRPSARASSPGAGAKPSPKRATRASTSRSLPPPTTGPRTSRSRGRWAAERILDNIRATLARLGIALRRVVQPGLGRGERCGARDDRPARRARVSWTKRTVRCGSGPLDSATTATGCS